LSRYGREREGERREKEGEGRRREKEGERGLLIEQVWGGREEGKGGRSS
jgi:hypothetical protein